MPAEADKELCMLTPATTGAVGGGTDELTGGVVLPGIWLPAEWSVVAVAGNCQSLGKILCVAGIAALSGAADKAVSFWLSPPMRCLTCVKAPSIICNPLCQ